MRRSLLSGLLVAATASLSAAAYVRAFGGRVHVIGDDHFFYAWQADAFESGITRAAGPRIGTPALLGFLRGVGVAPRLTPVIVAVALAAAVGLASAVLGQRALGLPWWALFPLGVAAATWTGTARLASGYLANLLALTCFAVGLAATSSREVRHAAIAVGCASFLGAGLAHPAVLPFWFAIHVGWLILTIPGFVAAKRGAGAAGSEIAGPLLSAGALIGASLATLGVILGPLHSSVGALADLELASAFFERRVAAEAMRALPAAPLMIAGIFIAVWRARRAGEPAPRRALLGWGAACLTGAILTIASPTFPGHRTLILATPLGVASGLVAAGAAHLILGRRWPRRSVISLAAVACLGVTLATAFLGLRAFSEKAVRSLEDRALPERTAAAYVIGDTGTQPVIVVFQPQEARGARYWKVRLNIIRSFVGDRAGQVHMYVGDPERLLMGRPTSYTAPADNLERVLSEISERTWPEVSQALEDGATVLVPKGYVGGRAWNELLDDGAPLASDELAVPRGLIHPVRSIPRFDAIAPVAALIAVLATLATLSAVGGGFAMLVTGRSESTGVVAALSPALGATVVVIASSAFVLAGHEVGGPAALSVVGVVGIAGWVIGTVWRVRTRYGSQRPCAA